MNHAELICHYGSGKKAAEALRVSPSIICAAKPTSIPHKPLSGHLQIRAFNDSNGAVELDERAIELARYLFPHGVANSPLATLLDKTA